MIRPSLVGLALACTACSKQDPSPQGGRASSEPPTAGEAPAVSVTTPSADAGATDAEAEADRALNVLLIVVDSLRADVLLGDDAKEIAPWMTSFAKRSVDYTRAYSISSSTARSMPGLLAGKYPSAMIRSGHFFTHWFPENVFLTERLEDAGHATLAAHAHAYFFPASGMNQGFTDYQVLPGTFMNNTTAENITSERLTNLTMKMLQKKANVDQSDGRRFFAYVHYMDPHSPYQPHDATLGRGHQPKDYYHEEIHFTDRWVGRLVDWCLEQPWGKQTAIVLTSDHGESFGEKGHLKHGYELWEELIRVPLIVFAPGIKPRRIDVPRSHIDLAPTILSLMGLDVDPPLRGKSLVPELRGKKPEPRPIVADLPRDNLQDRRRAIIVDGYKLLAIGDEKKWRLYHVAEDPREKKNLTGDRTIFNKMKRKYEAISATIALKPVRGSKPDLRNAPPGRRW